MLLPFPEDLHRTFAFSAVKFNYAVPISLVWSATFCCWLSDAHLIAYNSNTGVQVFWYMFNLPLSTLPGWDYRRLCSQPTESRRYWGGDLLFLLLLAPHQHFSFNLFISQKHLILELYTCKTHRCQPALQIVCHILYHLEVVIGSLYNWNLTFVRLGMCSIYTHKYNQHKPATTQTLRLYYIILLTLALIFACPFT